MVQGSITQKLETVFIIEDEALLCDLIYEYIKTIPGLEIIGTSGDGQEAIRKCFELKPDLIILDIRLPEVSGLEILMLLKRRLPDTKVLIFTGSVTAHSIKIAIEGDADGFVEKAAGLEDMKKGIETIAAGGRYYSEAVTPLVKAYLSDM